MATGGSVESVTLRGRIFPVPADQDVTRKLGGFENEVQMNGNGTARLIKLRVPWSLGGLAVECDSDRGDQEFLQNDLANESEFFPVEITTADGITYQGVGQLTGGVEYSSQKAIATINLMGPGEMTQQ